MGIETSTLLPHPDDIIIDIKTGQVEVNGPFTKEEKVKWDRLRARKVECDEIIAENEKTLRAKPQHKYADFLRDEIQHEKRIRNIIARAIKD